jgi:hypothetical protein
MLQIPGHKHSRVYLKIPLPTFHLIREESGMFILKYNEFGDVYKASKLDRNTAPAGARST